jgi:manganese/iron transport system substrate-binding protein
VLEKKALDSTALGIRIRRPGRFYVNFIAAFFLTIAALAACGDDNGTNDDATASQTPTPQTSGAATGDAAEPLNVVVSLPFFPSMVEAVGGERVDVRSIVPQGVDAHTYQPSPSDARAIADADLIFVNGLGLEEWLEGLIESAGGVDAPVIELADGLQDYGIETDGHHHDDDGAHHEDDDHHHADDDHHHGDDDHHHEDDDHHHDGDDHHDHAHDFEYGNPHFWLSPAFGIHYVERIAEGLAEKDPDNEDSYRTNANDYIAEIEEFDEWAKGEMTQIPEENRKMVTFHDAFPYFAEHYDLEVVGVVVRSPGREPGAQELAQLVDDIRDVGVPAVFIEPQFNPQLAEVIADEAGVTTQLIYSDTPPEGVGYLEMMRLNVESVVEGLS